MTSVSALMFFWIQVSIFPTADITYINPRLPLAQEMCIRDSRGLALATTNEAGERNYAADESMRLATAHVIGDTAGQTLGAEALFAKYLLGFDQDFGEQLSYLVSEKQRTGADIMLTVDAALSEYAYSLLEGYNGAILLMNYKTGEVLACTARPGFDPARMKDYATGGYTLAEGSMVNRATMGRYTPCLLYTSRCV